MNYRYKILAAGLLMTACTTTPKDDLPKADEVLTMIGVVNRHWQQEHVLICADSVRYAENPDQDWTFGPYTDNSPFWHNAAYHTGNMEVCKLSDALREEFVPYSLTWAKAAQWMGATSSNPEEWEYHYGETPKHVLFGDWQICFQTYCDLYRMAIDGKIKSCRKTRCGKTDCGLENCPKLMIARAREVMEYEMQTPVNDYWWWADGLYMVMPTMTKLYNATGNQLYLDKLSEYWSYSKGLMYDTESHLFYRDGKYIYPEHASVNGQKDFWARGCGWVVAGLAKVLQDVPQTWEGRDEFRQTYLEMCQAVKQCQQPEGYWTRSLLDPECAPGPETSGTAFFTYGLLWGVNNGLLERQEYLPCILKAWEYLTTVALQEDYSVGYVQPIGERAIPGQTVDQHSTANFGTGAFLLACCEMYRLVTNK